MLSDLQRQKLAYLFRVYDTDGNGFVELKDYQRVLGALADARGLSPDDPGYIELRARLLGQWQAVAAAASADEPGRVSLDRWLALWNALLQVAYDDHVSPITDLVFETMDADGDGAITLQESRAWFAAYTGDASEADAVFPLCDLDGDGRLTRAEWSVLVQEFFFGNDASAPGNHVFGRLNRGAP